jgi:alkylated DNA nucleotide flippase Atl1
MSRTIEHQVRLARRIQAALTDASDALSEYATALEGGASLETLPVTDTVPLPEARGPRQQQILGLLTERAGETGLKTSEVSRGIEMEQPNTYLTLQALEKQGLIEKVPGVEPQHWRLATRFRLGQTIVDVANLVAAGEWTSYGDISQVVYGHYKGGPAVASAIRNSPDFENHHRIVRYDGQIAPDWEEAGLGRDECAERLEAEGIEVDDDFYAHGRHRVDSEELARRLAEMRQ